MKNLVLKLDLNKVQGLREWQILHESDSIESSKAFLMNCAKECSFDIVIDKFGNAYDEELEEVIYHKDDFEFKYLGNLYEIVDQSEFNEGFFNSKYIPPASDAIKKYFGLDPDEVVKTYHLNWGDGEYIGTDIKELISDFEGSGFSSELPVDDELELTVIIKKKMTRREVENLPDFDL